MAKMWGLLVFVILCTTRADGGTLEQLDNLLSVMETKVDSMARQLTIQQTANEERIRTDGNSGIKQLRQYTSGTKPYHTPSHVINSALGIHDHANYDRTCGMGEFNGVLNGVDFRTRHNDYKFYMPHKTSTKFHATEPIPFPDVPPEVLAKKTINDQIKELREWFKAWNDQDHSKRDYRKYFKPVLCYLEGAWTGSTGKIDESFESDRHFIDANSWFDLQNKIRFTAFNGRKSLLENYAYLPTTIQEMINGTHPVFAQWNYRLMCYPIKDDVPFNRLRVVDDLGNRMAYKTPYEKQHERRSARYQLNPINSDNWEEKASLKYNWMDRIMAQIPGKDNHPGNLQDESFGVPSYQWGSKTKRLNTAYYHRWYSVPNPRVDGIVARHRSFSDSNVFMAETKQDKVAKMNHNFCSSVNGKKVCKSVQQRWTYAVPIEIIYMTPLQSWNPFDIELKLWNDKTVNAKGRNGGFTKAKAYNGGKMNGYYYLTPSAFFTGGEVGKDPADTSRGSVGVLDRTATIRSVRASGIRAYFPQIPGIGKIRQRYPIYPIHEDGSGVWKELSALQDIVMEQKKYFSLFRQPPISSTVGTAKPIEQDTILEMSTATRDPPGQHVHRVTLTPEEIRLLKIGKQVTKTTTQQSGHSHQIVIVYNKNKTFAYKLCDGKSKCWDEHAPRLRYA